MSEHRMDRREAIASFSFMLLGSYGVGSPSWERFVRFVRNGGRATFFSPQETTLVTALADLIIPKDHRSGSASEAGAVPYMDFVLSENGATTQAAWRDGLRWFDEESMRRFGRPFTACTADLQAQLLDDVAWPARARPEHVEAAAFFARLRDLSASAFFSSRMGVEDLGYQGNVFNPGWQGAPPAALEQLGVSYDEWDRSYGGLQ